MKKFFTCSNNGVIAIVNEDVYNDIHRQRMIRQYFTTRDEKVEYSERWRAGVADNATNHLNVPTFTFVRPERFQESPWFTASYDVLNLLIDHIESIGGMIEDAGFYVPFSNGCEVGIHGKDSMKSDLTYVTTSQQFCETFGISLAELVNPNTTHLGEALSDMIQDARRM
jgi:hypothetical protein